MDVIERSYFVTVCRGCGIERDNPGVCPECRAEGKRVIEAVPAEQLRGAVDRVAVLEQALLIACENNEGGAARFVRMAQSVLADAGGQCGLADDLDAIHQEASRVDPSIDPLAEITKRGRAAHPRKEHER